MLSHGRSGKSPNVFHPPELRDVVTGPSVRLGSGCLARETQRERMTGKPTLNEGF